MLLGALATPAAAQEAVPCDWAARADGIVEPWEDNTATFANGAVRLALIDTVEPAAGAFHLLILSPPLGELGERQCRTLGIGGMGFAGLDFASLQAEMASETMAAFAEVAKKVQMETVELMLAAGKDISEDATTAVKKATADVTAAAKKATASAK